MAYGIHHYAVGTKDETHTLHRFADEGTRARWERMFNMVNGVGMPSAGRSSVERVTEAEARAAFPEAFGGSGRWEGRTMYVPTETWAR